MNTEPLRHLPRKSELEYTEAMCGEIVTDASNGIICGNPANVTCERCVDIDREETWQRQEYLYHSGQLDNPGPVW